MEKNYPDVSSGPWNTLAEQVQVFITFKQIDYQIKLSVAQKRLLRKLPLTIDLKIM